METNTPIKNTEQPSTTGVEALNVEVPSEGSLVIAVGAGSIAAIIGAIIWAAVTIITNYQIGWMAVGVGFLVGISVRYFGKGDSQAFAVVGAVLALVGCLLGNIFTILGIVSQQDNVGIFKVVFSMNWSLLPGVMAASFSPMDLLFYGIAIYEGYKFSVKKTD